MQAQVAGTAGRGGAAALALALCLGAAACGDDEPEVCAPQAQSPCGPTTAKVDYVVDGDTVRFEGFSRSVRIIGINTPELTSTDPGEKQLAQQAKAALEALLTAGRTVTLIYENDGSLPGTLACNDSTGSRLVAYLCIDGELLNERLLRDGNGCCLLFSENTRYRDRFRAAEAAAQAAGKGVWQGVWLPGDSPCAKDKRDICHAP